jgi:hypothetical protein
MASSDTLVVFTPLGYEPPATNYATLDTRNAHPVLDFDAAPATEALSETAIWTGVLPQNYSGGGITVYLHWAATTATNNNVLWGTSFERIGAAQQDIDTDGWSATEKTVTAAANGTSGNVIISSTAHANGSEIDSIAVGESFRLRVRRIGANAADTMTGDAELLAVELRET